MGKRRYGILASCMCAAIILTAAALFSGLQKKQQVSSGADEKEGTPAGEEESGQEKWQEGVVSYNGKHYKYNRNIRTYLLMGIDKDEPVAEAEDSVSGGQSDAMFLIAMDRDTEQISVISIQRNTMTEIEICDKHGLNKEKRVAQICLQHGYGDGKHYSCSQSAKAVSNLFYSLPISGYLSINMGGIPGLNDAVGGVEVEVLQDISSPERGVELRQGEQVLLTGDEAYCYLRIRDTDEFDSATDRLHRQEQYIAAYIEKLKTAAGDTALAAAVYDSASEYLVTNVDFASLITELAGCEFDESRMYTVPGETVMGEQYEEYYADDEALYELILQIFYQELDEEG